MITEEFVEFETAKLLKEAGFPQDNLYLTDGPKTDDPLYVWYDNRGRINLRPIEDQVYWNAPTQAQAMRWLREEEYINAYVIPKWDMMTLYVAAIFQAAQMSRPKRMGEFFTYEEAAEAGIQAACKYLIEKYNKD